jgi:hypothetical protein
VDDDLPPVAEPPVALPPAVLPAPPPALVEAPAPPLDERGTELPPSLLPPDEEPPAPDPPAALPPELVTLEPPEPAALLALVLDAEVEPPVPAEDSVPELQATTVRSPMHKCDLRRYFI